ncbi:MAG: hypothetical protein DHS20C02_10650 [Micavibrio sp.]|nr:MAG: hypothetical protein DHS20C02_10650 [Micavibrio sp.]
MLFVLLPDSAGAQDKHYPIGQVAALEGQAYYVSPDKKKNKIRVSDPIYLNSVVQTAADSKILIIFIDDTQIILAENTELLIDKYIFDPYDPDENEADFSIIEGSFHWFSGMISKRERPKVKIKTAVGSIGIRGTKFWAGRIDGGYGVLVTEGLVGFNGSWGTAEIPGGKGVFIPGSAKIPDEIKIWPKVKKDRALITTTFTQTRNLEQQIKQLRKENVTKRHDYRGKMFPYKQNPYPPGYRPDPDDFFSEEFQELRDRQ